MAEPALATDPVAALIGAFRVAFPGVTVRLAQPENGAELAARLADGRSEVGLSELPLAASVASDAAALATHVLLVQDVLLVRPPGTPQATSAVGVFPVQDLVDAPIIATPLGTSSRALLERALAAASVTPAVAVETEQRDALLPLVLAGAGSALLPRPLAEQARQRGGVLMELMPPLRRTVGLVHRRGTLSTAARAFVAPARSARGLSRTEMALVVGARVEGPAFQRLPVDRGMVDDP